MSLETRTALSVIEDWLAPLQGLRLLDIGCGRGGLARTLAVRGAEVTGLEPDPGALSEARAGVPEARFEAGVAQALPFADGAFDVALFSNSLHHVPPDAMDAALTEALRVARKAILVIEPLAEGPFFEAMQPIEDETALRQAAQEALSACLLSGRARQVHALDFEEPRSFPHVDAFLAKVVAADPARTETAQRLRPEVEALMQRWGVRTPEGFSLPQPHRAVLLSPAP